MARPQKKGLEYFPLDVNFYGDIKVRKLMRNNGGGKAAFVAANLTDKAVSFPVKGLSPNADKPLLAENGKVSTDGAVSLGPWGFVVVDVK